MTVRGSVAQPAISHADCGLIVGLQHQSHVENRCTVGPPDDPVGTAWQYGAAQSLALERAAGDETDAPVAGWSLADRLHAGHKQRHGEQRCCADFGAYVVLARDRSARIRPDPLE